MARDQFNFIECEQREVTYVKSCTGIEEGGNFRPYIPLHRNMKMRYNYTRCALVRTSSQN